MLLKTLSDGGAGLVGITGWGSRGSEMVVFPDEEDFHSGDVLLPVNSCRVSGSNKSSGG